MSELPIIEQRRIEAMVIKPIFEELKQEVGEEQAKSIISNAIRKAAVTAAEDFAKDLGVATSLDTFRELTERWKLNGALEEDVLDSGDNHHFVNVTRCKYAEMYEEMGLKDIGHLLSCNRDEVFCQGYDPRITLERTQTIMSGASHCDFRYRFEAKDADRE